MIRELISALEDIGVRLWEEDGQLHYRAPRQAMTADRLEQLRTHKQAVLEELRLSAAVPRLAPDPHSRHQPFPLTDVQSAYVIGRSTAYRYGGTGCQAYLEVCFPPVDPQRLCTAWRRLVARHDALRTVVHPDGYQQVLSTVAEQPIEIMDVTDADPAVWPSAIDQARGALATRDFCPDQWPLHDLRITRTLAHTILHLSIDLLICDYASVQLLLGELERLCFDPDSPLPALEITHRDYVLAERTIHDGRRERDRAYWWARLDEDAVAPHLVPLAPAPALPLRSDAEPGGLPTFRRLQAHLPGAQWQSLGQRAIAHQVTPTVALLTAYAEVIARWSGQQRFTVNLPMFKRLPLHPQADALVGDFTCVELLTVDFSCGGSFASRAAAVQAQLWQDLDHSTCSGIEVMREVGRRRGADAALMPVVFTSTVGVGDASAEDRPALRRGQIIHGSSRSPQVWIDCQAMEQQGALLLGWDVREGVFPDGLAEDAFTAFEAAVRALAVDDEAWQWASVVALPPAQCERRRRVNDTARPVPGQLLHDAVVAQARETPDRTAVIANGTALSYQQLLARAAAVAEALTAEGDPAGQLVAIVMDKGWEQVVAVLGILLAGAAYLPVETDQPPARRQAMLADAGVRTVLTQPWIDEAWAGLRVVVVDDSLPSGRQRVGAAPSRTADDLAYVIYTSGSTGVPKGVMVSHGAACNTVLDINDRFAVGPQDRVLGLAGLGFDLSVYDIFGPLSRGGCLILPERRRLGDPSHWAELITRHEVTIWNSVPAQFQMLDSYLGGGDATAALSCLRLALLSGDWIPVALVGRMAERLPDCRLISLGGATEAAIWSIVHPIDPGRCTGRSVPYGTPLTNQGWYVLDAHLQHCPDHTPGELHITGSGLAIGYLGDQARTDARFIRRPGTGERLYRTGDLGRYLPDGTIELLGRVDDQLKIRGHRVEPAEVSAAAQSHSAVACAVALATGDDPARRQLALFVTPARFDASEAEGCTVDAAKADASDTHGRTADPAKRVVDAATATGSDVIAAVDLDLLRDFLKLSDEVAFAAMARTLREAGLFDRRDEAHTAQEAAEALGAHPRHARAVRRWLRALVTAGLLCHDPVTGRYRGLAAEGLVHPTAGWERLEELGRRLDYGLDLLRLVRTGSEHLPELLRGEEDPLQMLFPHGTIDVASAVYRDNLVSRSLNEVAITGLREIAAAHRGPGPLRFLEAGAGVGGTSAGLIPVLDGYDVDYLFTDVSQFFLGEAQQRFAGYPWVRYGLFDINEDAAAQGLTPNSFDVILCANVLHNAKDAPRALRQLRELLAPGGWLVFMEATVERGLLLVSMEFIDGLSEGFTDVRALADQTFLTHDQWLALLEEAGAQVPFCFPAPGEVLADAGQQLFFTRMKTDRIRLTHDELTRHLTAQLPEYMLPGHLEILDGFPLTANGKVDRARLCARSRRAADRDGVPSAGTEPVDDLERRIAAVWSQVLGRQKVARDADFFQLGGDSLLLARLVGRLKERVPEAAGIEWEHLLRQLLRAPSVAALAAELRGATAGPDSVAPAGFADGRTAPALLVASSASGRVTVLVHDGSGTLMPYQALLGEYRSRPADGPVVGVEVGSLRRYLGTEPALLIPRLGGEYAQALLRGGGERFHVVGYCMGGLIATEVARALAEAGAEVDALTVISCYRPGFEVHDELIAEYTFALSLGIPPASIGFPADDGALGEAIAAVLAATPGRLGAGALAALGGAFAEVAGAFRTLGEQRQKDRLAAISRAAQRSGVPLGDAQLTSQYNTFRHSLAAVTCYRSEPYAGDIVFLRHTGKHGFLPGLQEDMAAYWERICLGRLVVRDIEGDHFRCIAGPRAAAVRELLDGVS